MNCQNRFPEPSRRQAYRRPRIKIGSCLTFLVTALSLLNGCSVYEDNYKLTPPVELASILTFPDIVSIKITQSSLTSPQFPAKINQLNMSIQNLNQSTLHNFSFILKIYNKIPFAIENLGYTRLIEVSEFDVDQEITIDLCSCFVTPLHQDLVEVEILDSGIDQALQSESRGSYEGTYYLLNEDDILSGGRVLGSIDYHGKIKLELQDASNLKFIKGQAIANELKVNFYSDLTDIEGRIISPFNGALEDQDSVLEGIVQITTASYTKLQLRLKRKTH